MRNKEWRRCSEIEEREPARGIRLMASPTRTRTTGQLKCMTTLPRWTTDTPATRNRSGVRLEGFTGFTTGVLILVFLDRERPAKLASRRRSVGHRVLKRSAGVPQSHPLDRGLC